VIQGHRSTVPVTLDAMIYHTGCVARGNTTSLIIADMPFMSYATESDALGNGAALMRAGAQVIKLEGGGEWIARSIAQLSERGIPVCGHLGLTPQSVNSLGGYIVQGRDPENAQRLIIEAERLQSAGAALLVLECIPRALASTIAARLSIPVIGIGAGNATDAQVLVLYDMLGLNPRPPRFVRNFLCEGRDIPGALGAYAAAVRDGSFPATEHGFD
jgi:3-methyl-2-oxobutanoate hydroxymethyltransferase